MSVASSTAASFNAMPPIQKQAFLETELTVINDKHHRMRHLNLRKVPKKVGSILRSIEAS